MARRTGIPGLLASVALVVTAGVACTPQTSGTAASNVPEDATISPPEPSQAPPAEAAAIRRDWLAFFSGATPATRRVQLLQNGSMFQAVVRADATMPGVATEAARIDRIQLTGSTAVVDYWISAGGRPMLQGLVGEAVQQAGIWKVSAATYCGVLAREGAGQPAACPMA
jgi:hypothetical protein